MSLKIVRNDITKMNTEAIVNTANSKCEVGEGCDVAVYNAAGFEELLSYRKEHIGEKNEGDAFITPGFNLAARYIIHVVSPLFVDGSDGEEEKLRKCYSNALNLALENGIKSISFPLVATGSFGYPKADALRIAMDECNAFLLSQNEHFLPSQNEHFLPSQNEHFLLGQNENNNTNEIEINIVVFDSAATEMAQKLYPQLETFIDHNYVCEISEEEYGDNPTNTSNLKGRNLLFGSRILRRSSKSDESIQYAGSAMSASRASKSMPKAGMSGPKADILAPETEMSIPKAEIKAPKPKFAPGAAKTPGAAYETEADEFELEADEFELEADEFDFEDELENSPALKERIRHLQDTFGEYFFYLVESKGFKSSEVQNGAWITKQVYSKIKTNQKEYKPSKRVAMQLCIGLHLSIDEAIDLLARAGFAFSPSDKQDLIFRFFIENRCYDILGLSDALEKYGIEPIVDW